MLLTRKQQQKKNKQLTEPSINLFDYISKNRLQLYVLKHKI